LAAFCDGAGSCPAPQTQACNPYACNASGTTCNGNCQADSDCAGGNWCSAGVCVPLLGPGVACGEASQCGSNHCTDGVCCNTACDGQCEACAEPGQAGTCTVAVGSPRGERTACADDGKGCGGACDGTKANSCNYPVSECRGASCTDGTAVLAASCNGAGSCPAEQDVSCGTFACGGVSCRGNCAADADCSAGSFCAAGVCTQKSPAGGTCSATDQCQSGFCTDGVCCDTACNGQCQACDVPGSAGVCSNVAGSPHGTRTACGTDGTSCGGACDGTSATACAYPVTECRDPSCANGAATLASSCDGAGHCPARQTQSCGAFACGATACLGNCGSDTDCASGDYCAGGICKTRLAAGATCGGSDQCGSGFCVDGICCDQACNGQCQACDVAGHAGACTAVAGAPHGARTACGSDGSSCGGTCDGHSGSACAFPAQTAQCRAPSCSNGVASEAAFCDGAGSCPAAQTEASACTSADAPATLRLAGSGCTSGGAVQLWPALFVLVLFGGRRRRGMRRPASAA
jgi:hypothetical protein